VIGHSPDNKANTATLALHFLLSNFDEALKIDPPTGALPFPTQQPQPTEALPKPTDAAATPSAGATSTGGAATPTNAATSPTTSPTP
jgi:hypothetical protein